ncbi:dipeptide epimerase [Planctomycetales bacterium]|nr:dipeptide epimerase [Planctomycetales bacterium]
MRLRNIRVDLPVKHVFENSRRAISVVRTIVVELEQDGLRGHGEVYEDLYYGVNIEEVFVQLEKCREQIDLYALADPVAFWNLMQPILRKQPFAQNAIDCAACDLWGKMKNKPLWKIWGLSADRLPHSSYSIGLDSLERIGERFDETPDWSIYRLKLGQRNDLEILRYLREKTEAAFYVDINGSWDVSKTLKMLEPMQELGVKYIEQPLDASDFEGMLKLKQEMKVRHCEIPIFADESWRSEDDMERCAGVFDGVNIKLAKCGGLTPARQIIAKARKLGLKVSSANTIESSVGASATSQLASLFDYIGVDGPLLIEKKVGSGILLNKGKLVYPNENGTGVRVVFR